MENFYGFGMEELAACKTDSRFFKHLGYVWYESLGHQFPVATHGRLKSLAPTADHRHTSWMRRHWPPLTIPTRSCTQKIHRYPSWFIMASCWPKSDIRPPVSIAKTLKMSKIKHSEKYKRWPPSKQRRKNNPLLRIIRHAISPLSTTNLMLRSIIKKIINRHCKSKQDRQTYRRWTLPFHNIKTLQVVSLPFKLTNETNQSRCT